MMVGLSVNGKISFILEKMGRSLLWWEKLFFFFENEVENPAFAYA
jgi:hypothetical protein